MSDKFILVDVGTELGALLELSNCSPDDQFTKFLTSGRIFRRLCEVVNSVDTDGFDDFLYFTLLLLNNKAFNRECGHYLVDLMMKVRYAFDGERKATAIEFKRLLSGSSVAEFRLVF